MIVAGHRLAAAVLVAACLSPQAQAQVQLRVEGEALQVQGNVVQVQGNVVVVPGGGPFAVGGDPVGGDPWWTAAQAPAAAAGQPAPPADQPAQVRLAAARRARAQSVLGRELSRVREACPGLDPAQRATVVAAGQALVEQQAAGRAPLANGMEAVLEKAIEKAAGPEVAVAYAEEVAGRVPRRKEAAVAVIVEAVDRDALLDDEQRRSLAATLSERWRPEWEGVAAMALRQRITFARLPAGVPDAVAAALDPETVAAWRARAVEVQR